MLLNRHQVFWSSTQNRNGQIFDASGVFSTPSAFAHTSFPLLFGCERDVKHTNATPLVIFFLQMVFVGHLWKLSEKRLEWLFDGLFSSWIDRTGCETLNSSSLTPIWQLKWTFFFFFLVYHAWGSALLATATKHSYGNFQQKAHSSYGEGGSGS